MQDAATPQDGDFMGPSGPPAGGCQVVRAELSALLAGDLPVAMRRELAAHVAGCERCAAELAAGREVIATLRALPTTARRADVWRAIERELAVAPTRRPFALEAGGLVAAGAGLAALLMLRNEAAVAFVEARLPDSLRELLLGGALRDGLLPTLFVLFGALVALLALPLLAAPRRPLPAFVGPIDLERAS